MKVLNEVVNIGYCTFKNMWSYGLKVHLAVTESGYILDYLVTLASVHDIQVAEELLETVSLILAF
ncbi:transposase [Streptococcus constellatus]|uniref:transposase n=1 Tax=Streptococcus constellatus TaxID=76860 RepID=UPI0009BB9802|nr:transposase [Streptococcus constellatus]